MMREAERESRRKREEEARQAKAAPLSANPA